MADPLSDPSALADYWRPLTTQEAAVAPGLIMVASVLIRRAFPHIDADIADGVVDQSLVDYVITEMVKSAIESGNRIADAKSQSDTVGPYARSVTYGDTSAPVILTDDLMALLAPLAASSGVVGTARLGLPHHCHPHRYPGRHWTVTP